MVTHTGNHRGGHPPKPFELAGFRVKKKRLIEERGLRCEVCKLDQWMGKPIPIELDHVNGIHDDESRENLRLICPNCHAQTETYKAKNIGRNADSKRQQTYKKYPIANYR